MRILVADQNALLLAAIAATFGPHCEVVTATRRDACMEHIEQRKFDVVVACEKLADYTGLELLSEIEALSPDTLRIFAARPESLGRLGKRLDLFGLLGTLSYPIEARKLVVALKVARTRLPGRPKPPQAVPAPVVRHIVLEADWDTGERLALLEQELEEAPAAPPAEPSTAAAAAPSAATPAASFAAPSAATPAASFAVPSAATPAAPSAVPSAATPTAPSAAPPAAAAPQKRSVAKRPRPRTPTIPTAAQREAFQRALARRNAARAAGMDITAGPRGSRTGGLFAAPPIDFFTVGMPDTGARTVGPSNTGAKSGAVAPSAPMSSQSLASLARMATTKRPLPGAARAQRRAQPKRRVFVVGSGIAAVLLVGVVSFELLRSTPSVEPGRHAHAAGPQLFAPNALMADNSARPPQVFSPPPPPEQTPAASPGLPQPQTFDPDTAPPDPPPPPALERPGPMEPPSMAHNGPPLGMHEGWNSE